jgi:hypothetical protein
MNEFDAIIVISDIAGFTQWLPMTTEGLVESKRRYIELTNRIITESGGEVVSFFGDCASCIFEISTEAMRQAQIGAGLVRLYKETSEFVLCDGARITPYSCHGWSLDTYRRQFWRGAPRDADFWVEP